MFDAPATAITNTNVSWLIPTMTAFGGYVSGFLVEWFRDARAYSREREAKATARSEARTDRRRDFQRQSFLDLQDAICEMVADVRQVNVEEAAQVLGGREWSTVAASVEMCWSLSHAFWLQRQMKSQRRLLAKSKTA
jgi:hypothetical protein